MAVVDDIAAVLGRTAPAEGSPERAQWDMWVSDARMLIEARLGSLAALDQARLNYVIREAVAAHLRRPDDSTMVQVSVDDASSMRRYSSSKGRVSILDEWWDLLDPDSDDGKAFSVDTAPCRGGAHMPWCDLMFNTQGTCSCGTSLAGYPIYELY